MELKLSIALMRQPIWSWLLIVPYGIETLLVLHGHIRSSLLIVPYGIET